MATTDPVLYLSEFEQRLDTTTGALVTWVQICTRDGKVHSQGFLHPTKEGGLRKVDAIPNPSLKGGSNGSPDLDPETGVEAWRNASWGDVGPC